MSITIPYCLGSILVIFLWLYRHRINVRKFLCQLQLLMRTGKKVNCTKNRKWLEILQRLKNILK